MSRIVLIVAATLAIAGCGQAATESDNPQPGSASEAPTASPAPSASLAAAQAPALFVQCKTCHAIDPGKNGIGPSLAGIHGRKAGTVANYAYSTAMKGAGLTWDDATLDRFIEAPMKAVPGTKMAYAGQKDPAKRAELIAYLKSL